MTTKKAAVKEIKINQGLEKKLDKQLAPVIKKSEQFMVIETQVQYASANEFLSVVKQKGKEIDDERKSITEPMNQALKAANAVYQPRIKKCAEVEEIVKQAMATFLRVQDAAAKKEEERLAGLRAKQNERREEAGKPAIATPLPTIDRPETKVETKTGTSVAKRKWVHKILVIKDIPQVYLQQTLKLAIEAGMLDKVLREAVSSGVREIAGVSIYEDFEIATSVKKPSGF